VSAIECKIIICGNEVSNASQTATEVVEDLAQNECLTKRFVEASEKYVAETHQILSELSN
jgi:glycerol-3-phosphate cytidylyltransferase-like family protein